MIRKMTWLRYALPTAALALAVIGGGTAYAVTSATHATRAATASTHSSSGTTALAAFAVPAASAGTAPAPAPIKINLHSAYERALPHATLHKVSGIVYPRGSSHYRRHAALAGCSEPNCAMTWNGGPVQYTPHVYLLLWGPNWPNNDPGYAAMYWFYSGLGGARDKWSPTENQYGDGSGNPGAPVFEGAWQDTSTPPYGATQDQLAAEADGFASSIPITDTTDAQVVVATQSGTCPQGFYSPSVCGTTSGYCGWHTWSNEPFINIPYLLDAGAGCGEGAGGGTYDGFSIVTGHEFAETVTDPFVSAWYDPADTADGGGEIGDKCAWFNPVTGRSDIGRISLATGSFAVQPLWDNGIFASAGDGCLDNLSLTSPGNQASTIGTAVNRQVAAASSSGVGLSYRASGLPPGLSLSSSGKISGTPAVTAGTYATRVTVSDSTGAAKSVSFTWAVRSPTGAIKGNGSKCADDYRSVTANGNKIDINACNGGSAQKMTFLANGEVTVLGKCIRDSSGRIILYTCDGATTEVWTRHSNGEYVIKYNGQCLTEPSTTNGTQLRVSACANAADQHWSLP